MQCRFHSRVQRPSTSLRRSRGYILISLMLFLALLAVAALAVLPGMAFQVKRDREDEMIHRGLAYSRGVRRFYKKFGRYPMRIEELENTNNLRFIRKRYTDSMNVVEGKEQDFKVLHMSDVMGLGPTMGPIPGGGTVPGTSGAPGFSQGISSQPQQTTVTPLNNPAGGATATTVTNTTSNTDSGNTDSGNTSSQNNPSTSGFNGPTFGGGPVLGVTSGSKKQSVREFCKKNHYNDWKFIYDPNSDLGGTLKTPWCPLATGQGVGRSLNPAGVAQPIMPVQPKAPAPPANPSDPMPPEQ